MYRILVVEDEPVIADELCRALRAWGFEASTPEDFSDILASFEKYEPHLVLLDISLPFYNGYYWCDRIRKSSKVPIVFLSSRNENMDIVMAMNMGGDDYIAKPVSKEVLIAKIQAMLRRVYNYESSALPSIGEATLDISALMLRAGDKKYDLTRNEARILHTLLSHKNEVVSREALMLALWDSDVFIDDNTLTVNINRLRKTLAAAGLPDCISTHKNAGYAIHE